MSIAAQAEFLMDDARVEVSQGVMADIREFMEASRECGGLLTSTQAAKILGVGNNQIGVWVQRGRIKTKVVLGVRMLSAGEVIALRRERDMEIKAKGGRGVKAATLANMVAGAWQDINPLK